jgi:hypothetical protein
MQRRVTGYSVQKLFTIRNLRLQNGNWLVDMIDCSQQEAKVKTISIGKKLNWQKLSEIIPNAVLNRKIKEHLTKNLSGITFAKLTVRTSLIEPSKGYALRIPSSEDESGNLLINVDTGNSVVDDIHL